MQNLCSMKRQWGKRLRRTFEGLSGLMLLLAIAVPSARAQTPPALEPTTPPEWRGKIDAERQGTHDANRLRTFFYNYGMVGDYETNPDLSVFHSVEVPKGTGMNYSDGITPFVLARVRGANGDPYYIMETGFRERQGISPYTSRVMRFEPRFGYFEEDPLVNKGRSIALSNDCRTWPGATGFNEQTGECTFTNTSEDCWYDQRGDSDDPGWCGSWNGFFGKRPNADQESFSVMDDQYYDAWPFIPDARDPSRKGLGLRVETRGFQWSNPQAQNVIFWHYDIVNEGTVTYEDIVFGLYMDSGVGGSARSCDGNAESDDDNAFYNRDFGLNLVYTWDKTGRGVGLAGNCQPTGYLGYAYLETPGNPFDGVDSDGDGIIDEMRDSGPGQRIEGQEAIRAAAMARFNMADFEAEFGPLDERPAFVAGVWWTGDEDLDWSAEFNDTGADGVFANDDRPADSGEGDGMPTAGEPNFDRTDINESDMIGLTGFKMNRIRPGAGAPSSEVDNIIFFMNEREWPKRLFEQFTAADENVRFDKPLVLNYNIGFLFASGPFKLEAGRRERFSLALAYGQDLTELESNVETVQSIYSANYQFATPPPLPTVQAFAGDGRVTLTWDNAAEKAVDPVSNRNDFEGYRVYRSTDPNFLDVQLISNGRGTGPFGNGVPMAQFDLVDEYQGFSSQQTSGVAYYLGQNTGLTHTFTDSTAVNGQTYYYAVTAYDFGSDKFNFFPSENAITVSRTLRGGTILPRNVAQVRPNAPVPGFRPAGIDEASVSHVAGNGDGDFSVRVLNSAVVPDGAEFRVEFFGLADSVRAQTYRMFYTDAAGNTQLAFDLGEDLSGSGAGPVAYGVQPMVDTPRVPAVDSVGSGFIAGDAVVPFRSNYVNVLPGGLRRPGFPEDLRITFADTPLDTSIVGVGAPARPTRFRIEGVESGLQFDFRFRDRNGDAVPSAHGEYIEVLTPDPVTGIRQPTWRMEVDTTGGRTIREPGAGDVYLLDIKKPYAGGDAFTFRVYGETIDKTAEQMAFEDQEPYVVPNPYVASAAFEPERFAVAGRGERRIEFRSIPVGSTIRIYTVRGELVQTLVHDGGTTGMVPWDLRSKDNLEVAPGLYIFHVDAGDIGEHVGKFAIIK